MPKITEGKVIGIVGSRRRNSIEDRAKCLEALQTIYKYGDTIVSGGCSTGADRFAEDMAKENEIPIMIWYASWTRKGRSAGFLRNTNIAEDCDVLITLCAPDRTGGTEDTVKKVLKLEKEVIYA